MKEARNYLFIFFFVIGLLLLVVSVLVASGDVKSDKKRLEQQNILAKHLLITDFCFSTESRHTRHISMPETLAAFQDLPGFHDHFPSSSFFQPPEGVFGK